MGIKRAKTLISVLILTIVIFSCQKEVDFQNGANQGGTGSGTGNNRTIVGDYDFVGSWAHTLSTVTVNAGGDQLKTVTVSDYATENNTGTVKITSNQFIVSNMSYDIDTMMNAKTYVNGVLVNNSDFPFVVSQPATSSTSNYVKNSADSITITGAFGAPDPSGNTPTGPVGARVSWSGDTLILKVNTTVSQTITQGGVPGQFAGTVNGITKLKKR